MCCTQLCDLLGKHRAAMAVPPRDVLQLDARFQGRTGFLFKVLSSVDDPHLAQLLLRIDFNKVGQDSAMVSCRALRVEVVRGASRGLEPCISPTGGWHQPQGWL